MISSWSCIHSFFFFVLFFSLFLIFEPVLKGIYLADNYRSMIGRVIFIESDFIDINHQHLLDDHLETCTQTVNIRKFQIQKKEK